jgi:hypothetical protein
MLSMIWALKAAICALKSMYPFLFASVFITMFKTCYYMGAAYMLHSIVFWVPESSSKTITVKRYVLLSKS